MTVVLTSTILGWWANFKLLSLGLGRGQLATLANHTTLQFIAVYAMPLTPHEKSATTRSKSLLGRLLGRAAVLGAVLRMLAHESLPPLVRDLLYALGLMLVIGMVADGPGTLVSFCLGLQVSPPFHEPYFSESVSEFWARRWNLTAANLLRELIYEPITEGRLVAAASPAPRPSQRRRAVAAVATFAASGFAHEFVMWCSTREVTGLWFLYFLAQAPLVIAETLLRRTARGGGAVGRALALVPRWVRVALTLAMMLGIGELLFFPPPAQTGLDKRVVASLTSTWFGSSIANPPDL
mmetsp:Transcript_5001/g.17363  ORF Transcript_5001/g.17363 Transcript_5001/m.17363 type:complete len:295 (-) Transcript_5001:2828-3712(-)